MRILIAEPDTAAAESMYIALTRVGHDVKLVHDGQNAWAALQDEDAVEVAFLAASLPGVGGVQLVRHVRGKPRARYLYVVVTGGWGAEDEFVSAIRAGADDAMTKPIDPKELLGRMYMAHRAIKLRGTLDSLQDALRVQSMNDALTGLWNHGAIVDMVNRELARAAREKSPVAVVLCGIDGYRSINEAYGHDAGDVVLREVGRRVRGSVRTYDGVGRYGGDQLLLCLPRCDEKDAANLADRIRLSVAEAPINTGVARIPVMMSFGVAATIPGDTIHGNDLIRAADGALVLAKARGKNRVETSGLAKV